MRRLPLDLCRILLTLIFFASSAHGQMNVNQTIDEQRKARALALIAKQKAEWKKKKEEEEKKKQKKTSSSTTSSSTATSTPSTKKSSSKPASSSGPGTPNTTAAIDLRDEQTYSLIISGGGQDADDQPRYKTISHTAYSIFQTHQVPTKVVASDGTWDFPPEKIAADSKKRVKEELIESLKQLKRHESLDIFITDHGSVTDSSLKNQTMATTGFVLRSKNNGPYVLFTHQELYDILEKYKTDETTTVRLTGIHCYAGGLNEIASKLKIKGVCSSTSTNDENYTTSTSEINKYAEGFFKAVATHEKLPFSRAHFAGMANDFYNNGRQQLSSQAYVETLTPAFDTHKYRTDQIEIDFLQFSGFSDPYFNTSSLLSLDKALKTRSAILKNKKSYNEDICRKITDQKYSLKHIESLKEALSSDQLETDEIKEVSQKVDTNYLKKKYKWLYKKVNSENLEKYKKNVGLYVKALSELLLKPHEINMNIEKIFFTND
jgi:hypothetical protein